MIRENVLGVVKEFLGRKEKNLVIQIQDETEDHAEILAELGFERRGDMWILSRAAAKKLVEEPNYAAHFKSEEERTRERLRTATK